MVDFFLGENSSNMYFCGCYLYISVDVYVLLCNFPTNLFDAWSFKNFFWLVLQFSFAQD